MKMSLDEMRGIARYIKRQLPEVRTAELVVQEDLLEVSVELHNGEVFYDGLNLAAIQPDMHEDVLQAFADNVHQFVANVAAQRGKTRRVYSQ